MTAEWGAAMADFFDRAKSVGKSLESKSKFARITGAIFLRSIAPGVEPVVNSHLMPPATPVECSRQAEREDYKRYADWYLLRAEQANARSGVPGARDGQPMRPDPGHGNPPQERQSRPSDKPGKATGRTDDHGHRTGRPDSDHRRAPGR